MTGSRSPRPTIDDVARRTGVSTFTVSRAMNGLPGVAETTRARIFRAADEMGWRPSASARALSRARADAVALVLPHHPDDLQREPFSVPFLAGVGQVLAGHDCALLLEMTTSRAPEPDLAPYLRLMRSGRADGFLLTDPLHDDPRFELFADSPLPAVGVGHAATPCTLPMLETDHLAGMATGVSHLIELGHRRIGFVGGFTEYEHVLTRHAVWERTLREAGLEPAPYAFADLDDPTGSGASERVMQDPFGVTAIAYTTDLLAIAGMARARDLGRRIPEELSVVGFDDAPASASTGLTSVRVDYRQLGRGAAEHLMALIADEPPPEFVPSPAVLVERSSTAPAPAAAP